MSTATTSSARSSGSSRSGSARRRCGCAPATPSVLAEYDQRGRILEGTREQMTDAAYQRWLADHLSGKASVLLATTNAQAAELARRARDELAALGLVATDNLVELADGNVAGVGDLIVARQNARIEAGEPGRRLANRDVLRIDAWDEVGEERVALVRRITGRDPCTGEVLWSAPFELPEDYIERHARPRLRRERARRRRAGRSTPRHLVVDETAGREAFYVGMSRGRERNTAYVDDRTRPRRRPVPGTPARARPRGSRSSRGRAAAAAPARRPRRRAGTAADRADGHRDDAAGTGTGREPGHARADLGGRDPRACHPTVREDDPVAAGRRKTGSSTSRTPSGEH